MRWADAGTGLGIAIRNSRAVEERALIRNMVTLFLRFGQENWHNLVNRMLL